MNSLNLLMKLQKIHCYDSGPGIGDAEPYLWTVFFKIDGDTVAVNGSFKLQGTATVVGTHGYHSNLFGRSAGSGDDLPIPPTIGEFRTTLRPIPLTTPLHFGSINITEIPAFCGCLVILMEEDNTPDRATEAGYQQLVMSFQKALNSLLPTLGADNPNPTEAQMTAVTQKVRAEVAKTVQNDLNAANYIGLFFTAGNIDDVIGQQLSLFSANDVENAGAPGISITKRWKVEGDWELTGVVSGTALPPDANAGICRTVIPAAAVYQHLGNELAYVFVPDNNGNLRCYFGSGTSGQWTDQGIAPNGAPLDSAPAAVTAYGVRGNYLYAFVRGNNGALYENSWNTIQWSWVAHGRPGNNQAITTNPTAYVFRKELSGPLASSTVDNIYVGVGTVDGHLWTRVRGWPTTAIGGELPWRWIDHGLPTRTDGAQTTVASEPAITTYRWNGTQRIYMFLRGGDGRLYERVWDGAPNLFDTDLANWHWTDHGLPAAGVTVASAPCIQMFSSDPTRAFCVFVVGSDGGLYLRRWNNQTGQWLWESLNKPANFPGMTGRPTVTFFRHDNTARMYVYLRGVDNANHMCFWDTQSWQWRHSEATLPRPMATSAAVIPFNVNGNRNMYSYWIGNNHKLYTYAWDAGRSAWSWLPLGSP